MDNENDVLCEKIINDIDSVFLKDPDIVSFEILPTFLNQNKSPVIHVEHNLGLESWCAKLIYNYAHKTIINFKLSNKYYFNNNSIIKYLNIALLINPDVATFWHIRRQLIEKNKLKVQREFQFAALILTKKPKSSEAFNYRRWLFCFENLESLDWAREIGLCDRCADKSSSNYHAWSHRQWVLQKAPNFLTSEIITTEKFIKKHISDYSCYNYRQFVISKIYEISTYDREEFDYPSLKEFINFYLITSVVSVEDLLDTLLPGTNRNALGEDKLKSFLYCCNLAAYDIKLCDDLKNMYGPRESFENHRRFVLKFIVDNCIILNSSNEYFNKQSIAKSPKYNYSDNGFLLALKKSEGLLGERHRKWCSLFLGFDY